MTFAINIVLACLFAVTPLLFHEMGHWMALRRYQVRVVEYWVGLGPVVLRLGTLRFGMLPIGGAVVPHPGEYAALTHGQRMQVALAGPFASFVYGAVAYCIWLLNPHMRGTLAFKDIALLNYLIATANLLPVPPLDGFQALSSLLAAWGYPLSSRAQAYANRIGNGLVYGIGFFVLGWAFFK